MSKTGLFGFPLEENYNENVEKKEEESSSSVEEPEQEKEEETSSSKEEQEMDDDEPDPWKPLPEKVGEDLDESYLKEVQQFLDKGKTQDYAEIAPFNALLPVSKRRLRRTYLEQLKWTHRIKHDVIHRKVMKTLRRFIEEDDMDFDEAAESAVAKRKFLINRGRKKKSLPEESYDDKEEENDILVTKT